MSYQSPQPGHPGSVSAGSRGAISETPLEASETGTRLRDHDHVEDARPSRAAMQDYKPSLLTGKVQPEREEPRLRTARRGVSVETRPP
eukprot:CAMPEP_0185478238 /NCGR_PEP_ID=MMETSP1366-20130426/4621_1 /TAXON_ID=38817 /ORGANISM="Gephyrocapsa oceanica, Strain RCC1303" /LENGTH=87 /DNA_ID=CAMNT_0028085483 /DNA_START=298 /DNA_END=558 /DNA_ORIENTATION=+